VWTYNTIQCVDILIAGHAVCGFVWNDVLVCVDIHIGIIYVNVWTYNTFQCVDIHMQCYDLCHRVAKTHRMPYVAGHFQQISHKL